MKSNLVLAAQTGESRVARKKEWRDIYLQSLFANLKMILLIVVVFGGLVPLAIYLTGGSFPLQNYFQTFWSLFFKFPMG